MDDEIDLGQAYRTTCHIEMLNDWGPEDEAEETRHLVN